jgi:hypothetical protein
MGRNYSYFVFGSDAVNIVTNQYANYEGNKIHEYKISRPLTLLDMGDVGTIEFLMKKGNESVQKSLQKSFRIRNGQVIRKSVLSHDLAVARFICRLKGIDGYYAPPLGQKYGSKTFHQEIMLCLPANKVNYVKSEVPFKRLKPPARKNFENTNYTFVNSPPLKKVRYY